MRYALLTAAAALLIGTTSGALANGTVKAKQPACPPRHHVVHHHKHHAHPCPQPCDPCPEIKSAFFFGGQVGWGFSFNKTKSDITFPLIPRTIADRAHVNANGPVFGLFAGYDHVFCNHVMLGFELGAKLTRFHGKENASSDTFEARKVKTRESYEASIRLGRVYNDIVLPYAKLGWTKTKLKYDAFANLFFPFAETRKHKFRNGLLLGAGIDVAVTCWATLGAEYTANLYQKSTSYRFDNAGNISKFSVRPFINTVTARLTFRM
jgi:opacity protein-like surface antigen